MKSVAAKALVGVIDEDHLIPAHIIPSAYDKNVVSSVAEAKMRTAKQTGVSR